MGYRSEVFLKAHFHSIKDRNEVIGRLTSEQQAIVREIATIPNDRPVVWFYHPDIKWYTTAEMFGAISGDRDVDALDSLVVACAAAANTFDDEMYVANTGVFCRVGEDSTDNAEYGWEPRPDDLGSLPNPWDMANIERSIAYDEKSNEVT